MKTAISVPLTALAEAPMAPVMEPQVLATRLGANPALILGVPGHLQAKMNVLHINEPEAVSGNCVHTNGGTRKICGSLLAKISDAGRVALCLGLGSHQ